MSVKMGRNIGETSPVTKSYCSRPRIASTDRKDVSVTCGPALQRWEISRGARGDGFLKRQSTTKESAQEKTSGFIVRNAL